VPQRIAPESCRVAIIGGGVVGCSIAYHLAQRGTTDVVLLERRRLTDGSTWHAAGLVGQLRAKRNLTRLMQKSVETYRGLEASTGYATGWREVGSLRVAASRARWDEITQLAEQGRSFGFGVELVSAADAQRLFPALDAAGLFGASWIPSDGYVDPNQLTHAFASGARAHGVSIIQNCSVIAVERRGRRIRAVRTEHGRTECEVLVNATGMWGRETAQLADVDVAVQALEHQYVVTDQVRDLPRDLPTLRDPDARFYLKPEAGGLLVGGWEARTRAPWDSVPIGFGPQLFAPDHDRFASLAEGAARRVPLFGDLGIRTWVNGPIPFTPDAEPLMGVTAEIENLFHCCGFSAGIAAAGGAGWALANWILDGDPGLDLTPFDVRRFGPSSRVAAQLAERALAAYGGYYAIRSSDEGANRVAS
jgi:glycine/D-amino acid oxidase-like deaminating enzyme